MAHFVVTKNPGFPNALITEKQMPNSTNKKVPLTGMLIQLLLQCAQVWYSQLHYSKLPTLPNATAAGESRFCSYGNGM